MPIYAMLSGALTFVVSIEQSCYPVEATVGAATAAALHHAGLRGSGL